MFMWVFIICMVFNALLFKLHKTTIDRFIDRTMYQGFALLLLKMWSEGWFEWLP